MQKNAVSHVAATHLQAHNIALRYAVDEAIRQLERAGYPVVIAVLKAARDWQPPVYTPEAARTHLGELAGPPCAGR